LGQAIPRQWLASGEKCGIENAATYFGPMSLLYTGGQNEITTRLDAPRRNAPKKIHLRFRTPNENPLRALIVNGTTWNRFKSDWVELPGDIGAAVIVARFSP